MDQSGWAIQIARLYLGMVTVETLLKAAKTSNQKCQALYHAGAWFLMRNNREEAAPLFQAAAADFCKELYPEHGWANLELARLPGDSVNFSSRA